MDVRTWSCSISSISSLARSLARVQSSPPSPSYHCVTTVPKSVMSNERELKETGVEPSHSSTSREAEWSEKGKNGARDVPNGFDRRQSEDDSDHGKKHGKKDKKRRRRARNGGNDRSSGLPSPKKTRSSTTANPRNVDPRIKQSSRSSRTSSASTSSAKAVASCTPSTGKR